MKTYYVLMKLQLWRNMQALTPAPLPIAGCGESVGALLVYETVEALRADHGDSEYHVIQPKGETNEVRNM